MGSRTSQTLKEIEEIRTRLDGRLVELERRLPPIVQSGRKLAALAAGGATGTGALLLIAKRMRSKRKRERTDDDRVVAAPSVTVKVLPAGTVPVALAGIVVWAGVRIGEAILKRPSRPTGGEVVRPMRARAG